VNATFKNTLGLLPNGVLIIDITSQKITFANREMMTLVGAPPDHHLEYTKMKDLVSNFLLKDHVQQGGSNLKFNEENNEELAMINEQKLTSSHDSEDEDLIVNKKQVLKKHSLWNHLINRSIVKVGSINMDSVFKSKNPKKYIQVKTQVINGGTQVIAICSDITRIKELEVQS